MLLNVDNLICKIDEFYDSDKVERMNKCDEVNFLALQKKSYNKHYYYSLLIDTEHTTIFIHFKEKEKADACYHMILEALARKVELLALDVLKIDGAM